MIGRQLYFTIALSVGLMGLIGCNNDSSLGPDQDSAVATSSTSSNPDRTSRNRRRPRVGLVASSQTPIADLPVPIGFKLVESISRSYESAGNRYIDHSYEGKAEKFEIERFYRLYMPLKGWTFRGSQMVRGVFTLKYEKAEEFCDIRISDKTSITGTHATITFNVQTLSGGKTNG